MQSRNKEIEVLRGVLKLARTDLYVGGALNRQLSTEVIDALTIVGKEKFYELSKEVYELLDSQNEVIRDVHVITSAFL